MTPTTPERWLPVVGYEGYYEVSDLGNVRSVDRTINRSDGGVRKFRGRILSLGAQQPDGRHVVNLYVNGRRATRRVAPLVLESFVGPRPEGMLCCHSNGICTDDRLSNLRWDTASGNERDKLSHGTHYLANRTHCPRRHPLAAPNLIPSHVRRGFRACLACQRARCRERLAVMRGASFDLQSEADRIFAQITQEAP